MRIVDLSHHIQADMPVYPGTDPPVIENICTVESCGFYERRLTIWSHTGTHMDAPAHMLADGARLDQLPVDHFVGPACVVDAAEFAGGQVPLEHLQKHRELIAPADFVLLRTGWDAHWGKQAYFSGYPVLSQEAARWLADQDLKGLGMDAISPDLTGPAEQPVHHILFARNMVSIENLTGLDQLPAGGFGFSCLPLKLQDADGSPLRAVAMLD